MVSSQLQGTVTTVEVDSESSKHITKSATLDESIKTSGQQRNVVSKSSKSTTTGNEPVKVEGLGTINTSISLINAKSSTESVKTTSKSNNPQQKNVTTKLEQTNQYTETNCSRPVTKIVFIKSHKTGSSTLASIFQRFGYRHELLFALPKSNHIFSEIKPFSRHFVQQKPKSLASSSYDILTNHAVYNRKEMDAVVPNAKYISIARDPVYQFESAFGYFEWAKGMGLSKHSNPLEAFMEKPLYYYTTKKYRTKSASNNGQLHDFGVFPESYRNMSEGSLRVKIDRLVKEIDLVLLTEYFDESLLLLKQLLCWEYDDIVYLSKGVRSKSHRYDISEEMKQKIRHWNAGDVLLYNRLNMTFWQKVSKYGPSFQSDLAKFRRLKQVAYDKCVDSNTHDTKDTRVDRLVLIKRQTGDDYCLDLSRRDVQYTSMLRTKLREKGP